jgi:hypothetical protein
MLHHWQIHLTMKAQLDDASPWLSRTTAMFNIEHRIDPNCCLARAKSICPWQDNGNIRQVRVVMPFEKFAKMTISEEEYIPNGTSGQP